MSREDSHRVGQPSRSLAQDKKEENGIKGYLVFFEGRSLSSDEVLEKILTMIRKRDMKGLVNFLEVCEEAGVMSESQLQLFRELKQQ